MSILEIALTCVIVTSGGWKLAKFAFGKDTAKEERRRNAAKLACSLKAYGLKELPELLIDYSVGDYSGMAARIKSFATTLSGKEGAVVSEFDSVFERVLVEKLKTAPGKALVMAALMGSGVTQPLMPVEEAAGLT